MKLSPHLLRSVALGLGMGAALSSCSLLESDAKPTAEHSEKCTKDACVVDCEKAAQESRPQYDCPGCGMG